MFGYDVGSATWYTKKNFLVPPQHSITALEKLTVRIQLAAEFNRDPWKANGQDSIAGYPFLLFLDRLPHYLALLVCSSLLVALVTFLSNAMCNNKRTLRFCSGNTCGITDEVYFPRDIWVDILTRLPGKMVGQCKCVCKRWQALIEEPSFVELHHFRAKSRPGGCYLVISSCANDCKDTHFFSANYEGGLAQHLFSYLDSGLCTSQACVNGFICLHYTYTDSIAIVNPITKEIVALPPYNNPLRYYTKVGDCFYFAYDSVSFGFDPSTKQYKVVNIYRVHKLTRGVSEFCYCECEIFTLGSQSWRKIDIVPSASRFEFGIDGVCLGGVIHWRNFSDNPLPVDDEIVVTFDLKDERFRVVSLPRGPTCMARLVEVGGRLAACLEYPEHEHEKVEEELWILDDYDNWVWVKERIMLPQGFVGPRLVHTIGSIQTGEILLHNLLPDLSPSLEIYYYGRNKRSLRKIEIAGHPDYEDSIAVFNYVENLFSLRDV